MTDLVSPSLNAAGILAAIPDGLRLPLIQEFNKILRNYRERRWEPAELNGGKFSEIVYTILAGHVEGTFSSSPRKPTNMYDSCKKLEQANATRFSRSIRIQIPRILVSLYEIRNNRNVGHVGGDVDPNHMDAAVVVGMAQWTMAELIRVFHAVSIATAATAVEALSERIIPVVWQIHGKRRVLNPSLSATDRALLILYSLPEGITARDLAESVEYENLGRFRSQVLKKAHQQKVLEFDRGRDLVVLSPRGIAYVEERIPLTAAPDA